jgi:hypothetical protein
MIAIFAIAAAGLMAALVLLGIGIARFVAGAR